MKISRKLKSRLGFTLAETLLAVLILLLVGVIVAQGVPVAKDVYEKVTVGANAEVLLSTTVNLLRDELGLAKNVTISDNTVLYYNMDRKLNSKIDLSKGAIVISYYDSVNKEWTDPRRLVGERAATGLLNAYGSVSYNNGVVTFKDLEICRAKGGDVLASLEELDIKVFSETAPEATTAPAG